MSSRLWEKAVTLDSRRLLWTQLLEELHQIHFINEYVLWFYRLLDGCMFSLSLPLQHCELAIIINIPKATRSIAESGFELLFGHQGLHFVL